MSLTDDSGDRTPVYYTHHKLCVDKVGVLKKQINRWSEYYQKWSMIGWVNELSYFRSKNKLINEGVYKKEKCLFMNLNLVKLGGDGAKFPKIDKQGIHDSIENSYYRMITYLIS